MTNDDLIRAERMAYEKNRAPIREPAPEIVQPAAKRSRTCAQCGQGLHPDDFKYCSDACRQLVQEKKRS